MEFIKKYNEVLNEAFTEDQYSKALQLILKYLTNNLGKIYRWPGFETVEKEGVELHGIRYSTEDLKTLRFNWLSDASSEDLHSIDFWPSGSPKPTLTLELNGQYVAKAMSQILDMIENVDSYKVDEELDEAVVDEYRTAGAKNLRKTTTSRTSKAKPKVVKAKPEKDVTKSTSKAMKKMKEIRYADPDTVYKDLDNYVNMVVKGIQPSLLLCGGAGLGKTVTVTKKLGSMKLREIDPTMPYEQVLGDWVHIKGASTPWGLYFTLYKYIDKLIVFDDCDSIFKDKEAENILKGALDSFGTRRVSWISERTRTKKGGEESEIPSTFDFTGSIIFISNLTMDKIASAVRSRAFVLDINLMAKDIIRIMKTMIKTSWPEFKMNIKQDACDAIEELFMKYGEDEIELNLRSLIKAMKLRASGIPDWKRMTYTQIQKQSND